MLGPYCNSAPDGDSPFAVYLLDGDPEILLHVPIYSVAVGVLDDLVSGGSSARLKSAIRSSACSRPTDTRMCPAPMPLAASSSGGEARRGWSAGWVTSVSGPPSDVAICASCDAPRRSARPASSPPARSKASSPPRQRHLPLGQVVLRVRRRGPGSAPRATAGWPSRHSASRCARLGLLREAHAAACAGRAARSWRRTATRWRRAGRRSPTASRRARRCRRPRRAWRRCGRRCAFVAECTHEVDAVVERLLDERRGEGRVDHGDRARDRAELVEVDERRAAGWPASRRTRAPSCPAGPRRRTRRARCRRRR